MDILVIDDHDVVTRGLRDIISRDGTFRLKETFQNASAFRQYITIQKLPAIALMDIQLPDANGIDLCRETVTQFPHIKCIALTSFQEPSYMARMIQSGASGFLTKTAMAEEIIRALHAVANGGSHFNVSVNEHAGPKTPIITSREREVLQLIAGGLTNQEVADKLSISITTVSTHRNNLLAKFDVKNTASLIRDAARHGLI